MYRTILITGTSSGIGNYLADYYDNLQDTVIGCSRSQYICEYNNYICDITKEDEVKDMFTFIKNTYGKLDILINNAGIASMNHSLLTPMETVSKLVDLNYKALYSVTTKAARLLNLSNNGRIVNIVSVATPLNLEGESVYASTKAAVESLTRIFAKEFSSLGITVNAIGPTPVETNLIKGVSKDKIAKLLEQQAIKRMGTFEDITNAIDFFIKPESNFITGQIIYLGGVF